MFGFFESQEKKIRTNAGNWLEVADKVYHYRRDVLPGPLLGELESHRARLRSLIKERDRQNNAMKLKLAVEEIEPVLRRAGGSIYPKTTLIENVEFFLVAAIVILGIRTYFVQPFKIPTNSMWPSYYGMTPEVYHNRAEEPGLAGEAARLVAFGAFPHRLDAPADGEVLIPIGGVNQHGVVHSDPVSGHTWLVIPAVLREYTLVVGDQTVSVRLSEDFDFDWAVGQAFFSDDGNYSREKFYNAVRTRLDNREFVTATIHGEELRCIRTGRFVHKGDRVLSFDVLTGDQLFVDRMSYNFVRPSVGSGFVFRTVNIHSEQMRDRSGRQIDQYYIKRLVGVPGDTLEVKGTTLWRNGAPITGAAAFDDNAKQRGRYPGYQAIGMLAPGQKVEVPPKGYYAMGDNSPNSEDSRYWGFVPYKDAVGRPLFIYFPFTRRWGPAH